MTMRQFIDAGAALLVDEYRRLGIDLLTALEKVSLLGTSETQAAGMPDPVDNRSSMTALMARMSGVQGSPV